MFTKIAYVLGPKPCFTTFYKVEIIQIVFSDHGESKKKKDDWKISIRLAIKKYISKLYTDQQEITMEIRKYLKLNGNEIPKHM